MKKILSLILFLILSKSLFSITDGQACKISVSASANKSLFVNNASLSNDADAVVWIETNVPAQRWVFVRNTDNTYTIKNAYSGKALFRRGNAVDGSTVSQSNNSASTAAKWTLTGVENQDGYYYITQTNKDGNSELYLETATTDDGSILELKEKKTGEDQKRQIWKIETTDVPTAFSQTVREQLLNGWKTKYYKKAPTGYVLGNGGWWGDAEMFEVVLDAYETTGDPAYETMFRELYKNFIYRNKSNWITNEFNDDIAWMVIASIRAYLMFGEATYLTYGKNNFDQMYSRALLPSGMLRWKETAETQNGTNSCINGPAEVAACYLAMALGDESYYLKAKSLYALQRKYLYVPATGQVYDSFSWNNGVPSDYNYWTSTYNQGTFLGAATMLYNHFGDQQYRNDAEKIMKYAREQLCDENGIINVCQVGSGDLAGFKGILMRYVRKYIVDLQKTEYVGWMQKNAFHAYNNCNSAGITSSAWLTKTPENLILKNCSENCNFENDPFGPSTAVSAAFNAPIYENLIVKDAYSNVEAENFNYLKGVYTQTGTGGNNFEIGNIKDGSYVAYNNVNFANHLASAITIRLSKASVKSVIEIRLGSATGDSIGTITVPREGDDWQIVTQSIVPTSGMQNVYFVFKGVAGQNNLFRMDCFHFLSNDHVFPDITDNGGILTSSVETNSLDNASDNYLTTNVTFDSDKDVWLQYQSPSPVNLQAYAVFGGSGNADMDIKSWKLQASSDGQSWTDLDAQVNQQFTARCQKKFFSVLSGEAYRYFRLNISKNNGNASKMEFAEWQLYGSSITTDDITADGGVLSAEFDGDSPDGTFVKLADKDVSTKYLVSGQTDLWIDYKANGIYTMTSYSLTSAGDNPDRDPKDWTVYASADGISWTKVDQQTGQQFEYRNNTQYYSINNDGGYQYFRLHITANNASTMTQMAEWQLFGNLYYDYLYNDITMNGGELTSSDNQSQEQLRFLTDNDGNTICVQKASALPVWVQYKSEIPAKILGYSVVAGYNSDKNPRNWVLQGSNDGQTWTDIHTRSNITFSQRGERKTYPVSPAVKYSYFRLNVTKLSNTSSNELITGELELHGTALASADVISNKGVIVSAEFADRSASEGVSMLIDKSENSKYCNAFYGSAWVGYQLPVPVKINAYSITSANDEEKRDPRSWTLDASVDGVNWDRIDARNDQKFLYRGATQFYACNKNRKEYTYFKLDIIENNSANLLVQLAEWQLLNIEGAGGEPTKIEVVAAESFNVYPNPVKEILYIDMPERGSALVYNISGNKLFQTELNAGSQSIRLDDLTPGFYLFKIQIRGKVITEKILKK